VGLQGTWERDTSPVAHFAKLRSATVAL